LLKYNQIFSINVAPASALFKEFDLLKSKLTKPS
jgi:hypothetical protein